MFTAQKTFKMDTNLLEKNLDNLSILRKVLIDSLSNSKELIKAQAKLTKPFARIDVSGLNNTTKSLLSIFLTTGTKKPVLIVTSNISSALKLQLELSILSDNPVLYFPANESSPYEMSYNTPNNKREQLICLEHLLNEIPSIIIVNAKTLLTRFLSPEDYSKYSISIKKGDEIDPAIFTEKLVELGYTRVPMVIDPGEFSVRGDICDIYPLSSPPVRIEFAFDEVETIRYINIETQRSIQNIDYICVRPKYNIILNQGNRQQLVDYLTGIAKSLELSDDKSPVLTEKINDLISQVKEFGYFEGVEYLAPVVHKETAGILNYLKPDSTIILDEIDEIESQLFHHENIYKNEYTTETKTARLVTMPDLLHLKSDNILDQIKKHKLLYLNAITSDLRDNDLSIELNYSYIPSFLGNLKKAAEYVNNLKKQNYKITITTEYPQRVKSIFSEWNCQTIYLSDETENEITPEDIIITRLGTSTGFLLPDQRIACMTDTELFGKRKKNTTISKRTSKRENLDFFLSPSDLKENDYVVHARHGIGKFVRLEQISIDNQVRDYLTIEYYGGDKLYVPVDQINLLTRYRGAGEKPLKLNKMGGSDWENIKRKARKSIEDIAQDLLNLYANRARITGFTFEPDSNWQNEMENAFEFVETPDQMQSITDVKTDMESEKPMDRLICGDVGYGKTEVAIRAAFKAVLSGKQVAFLVPTTILAQQHFNTLSERFLPYPVNIAMLSRFRTSREQKESINRLITGECDIVVGTHRLLQKDIDFKNLGLVVIDEEHRFGVKHKEKLKQLRQQVDVISMSATPIPRTLYMAMSGIRDMSIINTPPVNRKPIKTHVGPYSENQARSAIMKEIERGGQVYYVHNRVQSIHRVAYEVSQLVPEAKIVIAHGQMKEKELESIMLDFSVHKYDVLICTTIIESGLDIPNVNTIIIEDADCMGLAQLYQLRGRVGRSENQAYAYCFYKPKKLLSQEAKKRLMSIREFNTLGSGYQIALRDLEIRGIGNILGSKQHGHMVAIGFDLYCEMLEESINRLKGQEVIKKYLPVIDINVTAFIPDKWIGDKEQKIIEYKRLAAVESQRELEVIKEEWEDRFGKIPPEVENLIKIVRIRLLASDVGFNLIREEPEFIRIFTNYDFKTWTKFVSKIPPQFTKRTKWVKMPETSLDGKSAILVKYKGFTPVRLLNFLEELSFYLLNHLKDQKGD